MEKVISTNTRRNPQVIMASNATFSIVAQYNLEYILNENAQFRKELVLVKK